MALTVQTRSRQRPSRALNAGAMKTVQSLPTTKHQVPAIGSGKVLSTNPSIEQRQSFELVQTLMLVSLTSICYLRDLLPLECFEERDYESIRKDAHWAYDDFLKDHIPSKDIATDFPSQELQDARKTRRFRIICRGRSAAADKLHLWLVRPCGVSSLESNGNKITEKDGISDALMRHFLASVQLSIILDKNKPSEVVESYKFTFGYEEARLSGIAVSAGTRQPVTIKSAKHGLNMIIRYLIELVQTLPDLPETRFLTVHLFYRDDCPADYNPPGFKVNDNSTILVADSDLWKMNRTNLGQMDTGYHRVKLSAAFMSATHDPEAMSAYDVPIPSDLNYTREVSQLSKISSCASTVNGKSSEKRNVDNSHCMPDQGPITNQTSDKRVGHEEPFQISPALLRANGRQESPQALARHERLKSMLRSSPPKEGLTQTQPVQLNDLQLFDSETWELTLPKTDELWSKRERLLKEKDVGGRKYTIQCACGFVEREGELVRCDCCSTLQHQHCYGLKGKPLGKAHVCYVCLLEDNEESLLSKVQETARKRRTCWIVEHGHNGAVPSDGEFAKLIGLSTKQFTSMLSRLIKEGIVKRNRDSRKAGFKATGAPRLFNCEERAKANYQELGFLNPLSSIQHYYQKRDDDEELSSTECETEELVNYGPVIDFGRREREPEAAATSQKRLRQTESPEQCSTNMETSDEEYQRARKRLRSSKAMSPLNVSEGHDRANY